MNPFAQFGVSMKFRMVLFLRAWLAVLAFLFGFCLNGRLHAQGLDAAALLKPPTDAWPTYNGDYSGRRYSPLSQPE